MRTKASGHPSWPGVADSTQGRIHWRRPTAMVHFSLATLWRTIHSEKTASRDLASRSSTSGTCETIGPEVRDTLTMAQPQRTCWQQWLQHPQGLWFRKALFQVHLWVGMAIAIYVLAIRVSGSAIVYERKLMGHSRRAMVLTESGRRMSVDELTAYVQRAYPAYEVDYILEASQ